MFAYVHPSDALATFLYTPISKVICFCHGPPAKMENCNPPSAPGDFIVHVEPACWHSFSSWVPMTYPPSLNNNPFNCFRAYFVIIIFYIIQADTSLSVRISTGIPYNQSRIETPFRISPCPYGLNTHNYIYAKFVTERDKFPKVVITRPVKLSFFWLFCAGSRIHKQAMVLMPPALIFRIDLLPNRHWIS